MGAGKKAQKQRRGRAACRRFPASQRPKRKGPCDQNDEGSSPNPTRDCPRCAQPGHWVSDCPNQRGKTRDSKYEGATKPNRDILCFNCKEKGHMAFNCPKTTGLYCKEGKDTTSGSSALSQTYTGAEASMVYKLRTSCWTWEQPGPLSGRIFSTQTTTRRARLPFDVRMVTV